MRSQLVGMLFVFAVGMLLVAASSSFAKEPRKAKPAKLDAATQALMAQNLKSAGLPQDGAQAKTVEQQVRRAVAGGAQGDELKSLVRKAVDAAAQQPVKAASQGGKPATLEGKNGQRGRNKNEQNGQNNQRGRNQDEPNGQNNQNGRNEDEPNGQNNQNGRNEDEPNGQNNQNGRNEDQPNGANGQNGRNAN